MPSTSFGNVIPSPQNGALANPVPISDDVSISTGINVTRMSKLWGQWLGIKVDIIGDEYVQEESL